MLLQADLIIFPFMERFALAKEFTGYDVHDALGGSIGAWLSSMAERPSCKMASANSTLLLEAFRYLLVYRHVRKLD